MNTIDEINLTLIKWARYSISQLLSTPTLTSFEINTLMVIFNNMKNKNFNSIELDQVKLIQQYLDKYKDYLKPIIFEGVSNGKKD